MTIDAVKIATPRGATLEATVHAPATGNGAAVVFAPGRGIGRNLLMLAKSAEALATVGFTALRFDWAYTAVQGEPSPDLSAEREDLEAAIAHARDLPGVKKVLIGGKSLGTIVALARAVERSDDLAGLLLFTLSLHDPDGTPRSGAARLGEPDVPTLVLQGDRDPIGSLAALYRAASRAKHPPRIVVVPGGHLFEEEPDAAKGAENTEAAALAVALWARRFAGV